MFNTYIFNRLITLIQIIRIVKNWHIYVADFIRIINKKYITIELRNGIKYKVRSKTDERGVISEVWLSYTYTPKNFEIKDTDIVVDIGAHIGVFSVFASRYARNGKVFAFEPVMENFSLLEENIQLNKANNVIAINKAISSIDGEKEIFINDSTGGHSFLIKSGTNKSKVKTASLVSFLKEFKIEKIDFLKMDCEGAEYEILFNLPQTVFNKIKKISMEYHNIDKEKNADAIKDFLVNKGFKVSVLKRPLVIGMIYASRV